MEATLNLLEPSAEGPGSSPAEQDCLRNMTDAFAGDDANEAAEERDFDWFTEQEAIILERQPSVAVYRNKRNHVVIRSESLSDDEDAFIFLATEDSVKALIAALQRELKGGRNA